MCLNGTIKQVQRSQLKSVIYSDVYEKLAKIGIEAKYHHNDKQAPHNLWMDSIDSSENRSE